MLKLDAAIIGSGPAGLEAALNLKIRKKNFLLFGSSAPSPKIERAPRIQNYLGLPDISGIELQQKFLDHLKQMDIQIHQEHVSAIYPMGNFFAIATGRNTYEATAVILATGAWSGKSYPGEERLLGKGVGYCATCDAPLYKGKTVAILGWGDEAVYEANFVAQIAKAVYYLPVKPHTATLASGVAVLEGVVKEIAGEDKVSTLVLEDRAVAVDGVFLLRESIAPSALAPGIAVENGFIKVDRDMQTSWKGCFAAGDCTGKPHQYIRAAGQGQTAALNAAAYLDILAADQRKVD